MNRARLRLSHFNSKLLALVLTCLRFPNINKATAHWYDFFPPQVFMLDTQCSPKTPNNKEGFEHAQSCLLIIELPPDKKSNGHSQKR